MEDVRAYIQAHWKDTVRRHSEEEHGYALPYPFVVPCIKEGFRSLFYWDSYFAQSGLLISGRADLAKGNLLNFCYLIDRLGYVPNISARDGDDRSQPPLFTEMLAEYYEHTGDLALLKECWPRLIREHSFWKEQRNTPCGLSRYYHNAGAEALGNLYRSACCRVGWPESSDAAVIQERGAHFMAEAESGWDFCPRFEGRCADFAPVDLNAILYKAEKRMAEFACLLGESPDEWTSRAARRQELITRLCFDDASGWFYDYDFTQERRSSVKASSALYPLWAGCASEEQARRLSEDLDCILQEHGIAACAESRAGLPPPVVDAVYQWDFPNGWPCQQRIAMQGLTDAGYTEQGRKTAQLYVDTVDRNFAETGDLWEKYNIVTGGIDVRNEYHMPAMMGWTAGTYLYAKELLNR